MSTHQVRNSKTTSHRQTTHGPTAEGRKWFKLETDIQYILINISMRTDRHQCRVETWRPLVLRFSISDTWSIGYLPTLLKPHLAFCIIGVWNHWLWARQQRSTPRQHWTCHSHEWDRQIAATSTANSNHRIQYNQIRQITMEYHREHHLTHECISTSGHWSNLPQRKIWQRRRKRKVRQKGSGNACNNGKGYSCHNNYSKGRGKNTGTTATNNTTTNAWCSHKTHCALCIVSHIIADSTSWDWHYDIILLSIPSRAQNFWPISWFVLIHDVHRSS